MNAVVKNTNTEDFKVRDLALAELGRKRIRMAEEEMPGLMSIRAKHAQTKPLKGVGAAGMNTQTRCFWVASLSAFMPSAVTKPIE